MNPALPAGATHLNGCRDDPPTARGLSVADEETGLHLAVAMPAAVVHRQNTGEGQYVSVNLFSCAPAAQQQELTVYLNHGKPLERAAENVGTAFRFFRTPAKIPG